MKLGRLHLSGPGSWPDHVLCYETGNLLVGVVVQVRSWALGLELQGRYTNLWLQIYLGPWSFEVYFDRDRSFEDE